MAAGGCTNCVARVGLHDADTTRSTNITPPQVSSEYLSVNEWALVRELDATRRRKLHDMTDVDEVARQLKRDVPRMSTVNTMKFAEVSRV